MTWDRKIMVSRHGNAMSKDKANTFFLPINLRVTFSRAE